MDTLLHLIKIHVKAIKLTHNCYEKPLNLINLEWDMDAEEYIRYSGLVEQTLKLIAGVARWLDIPDLNTGLLIANTQANKQIIEGKTFHLYRLLLTLQDWQHCKEDPVSSRELFVEELYNAGVYLNLVGKICAGWPLLLISIRSDRPGLKQSGAFGKKGQYNYRKAGDNAPSTTTTTITSSMTSLIISPKMGLFGNRLCDNR